MMMKKGVEPHAMRLGDIVPNFVAESTEGKINFHEFIGDGWAMLFSHPADYTPVCTTELGKVAEMIDEFNKRNVKVVALSCQDTASHKGWIQDTKSVYNINEWKYPIISDPNREVAVMLGMLDPVEKDSQGLPLTARSCFVFYKKALKLSILYPASTGRSFYEVLRAIDSLQLTEKYTVATPVEWKQGEDCMVAHWMSDEEAKKAFPKGVRTVDTLSGKHYLRYTPQPTAT